ncbi:MSHA biogenesis protein MshQ [Halospina denitrificans]|uniref:MSHA biogenesis protein MshQ n=1 Tax=Halospina denitrificans TaxID=332522 RepID=A0A4R7JGQ3_9GAMM|nr:LamG domain-containing protein [Halospina denitrificans]TDT36992.1 MSHA biogenesis protein MshQ [Halospina denitrificans]
MRKAAGYALWMLVLLAAGQASAGVELSLEGETESPVEVMQGEEVLFEVEATGCDNVTAEEWRYAWESGDGARDESGATDTSPCNAAPLEYPHTYDETGDYTGSFVAEYCTSLRGRRCQNWETFDTDEINVTVTFNPDSLIYRYYFDGETWDGTAGEVTDYSGNNLDGTALGAATDDTEPARAGDPGTCDYGVFAGSDRIEGPASGQVANTTSFTLAAWVRLDDAEQNADFPSLIAYGDTANDGFAERFEFYLDRTTAPAEYVLAIRRENGQVRDFAVETGSNGSADPLSGNWVHLAVTYSGASRDAVLYVNGNEVVSDGLKGPQGLADATAGLGLMAHTGGAYSAVGDMDEPRVIDGVLAEADVESLFLETRPCGVTAFDVTAPAEASVCAPAEVTVTALNSKGNAVTGYEGNVQLATSAGHGNWSVLTGNGTLTPDPHTADDGSAEYDFVTEDDGEVIFGLSNERADELEVSVTDPDLGATGTSDPIQFLENAFAIRTVDALGDDLVAGRGHDIEIEALRRDPDSGECGPITAYDGDVGVKAWIDRSGVDPGGDAPVLEAANDSASMPDSQPANDNVAITFNQGLAAVNWQTSDVGQYALNLLDDSSGLVVDTNDDPIPVSGTGPEWTVRPFGFDVAVADNPGAQDAGGPGFLAAGGDFEVTLRAVTWQAGDDADDDGQPDGHSDPDPDGNADLSDNAVAGAFGGSGPEVEVSATLVSGPPDPADPGLVDGPLTANAFASGQDAVTAAYMEVGSISLLADLGGSYLGQARTVVGRSGYVGRFHPELFTAVPADGSFQDECNGFVYIGQDFGYALEPELEIIPRGYVDSGTGPQLTNYRGNWQRLDAGGVNRDYPVEDDNNALTIDVTPEVPGTLLPLGDGRMDYVFGADEYRYVKDEDARVSPFDAALTTAITAIDDGDAALDPDQQPSGSNPLSVTPEGVELRYGRLRLQNAYGPETLDLIVPMRAEYWDDGFTLNTDEGCWLYNTDEDVTLDQSGLSSGSTSVVSVEDQLEAGEPRPGSELQLTAPGKGNTGDVGVSFGVPVWLQDDFDRDGILEDPSAVATFGVFRGHDRIIYWREVQ